MPELRRVTARAVGVAADLVGFPLAPPWRRGVALALDVALLLVPTLLVALGAAALSLRVREPVAWRALATLLLERPGDEQVRELLADVAPVLVAMDAPGLPVEVAHAVEHGDPARLQRAITGLDFLVTFAFGDAPTPAAGQVVVPLDRLIPTGVRTVALFGVPALYFTLAHRGRRGATLGKRLLGIAVRRLDGGPLTLLGSLERFGGYFAVPGTVGIGLLELWRHPLRQLGHDRGAGTVVVLVRGEAAADRRAVTGRASRRPVGGGAAEPLPAQPAPAEPAPAEPASAEASPAAASPRGERRRRRRRRRGKRRGN